MRIIDERARGIFWAMDKNIPLACSGSKRINIARQIFSKQDVLHPFQKGNFYARRHSAGSGCAWSQSANRFKTSRYSLGP
jgi:hypothetical protein